MVAGFGRDRLGRVRGLAQGRDDLPTVGLQLGLFVAAHEVEVEVVDAGRLQLVQSLHVLRMPLTAAVRGYWRQILLAAFTRFGENAGKRLLLALIIGPGLFELIGA